MGGYTGLAMSPRFERFGQVILAIKADQLMRQWSKFEPTLNSILAQQPVDTALANPRLVEWANIQAPLLIEYSKFANA
jgi:hypothetical protein